VSLEGLFFGGEKANFAPFRRLGPPDRCTILLSAVASYLRRRHNDAG
jgi:hypothetical protein